MSIEPELLDKIIWKSFWDRMIEETVWTPEFVQDFFDSDEHLHCSAEFLATAHSYQDDLVYNFNAPKPNISSSGQKFTPGILNSHAVQYEIKNQKQLLELPSIEVTVDAKPYITLLQSVKQNSSSVSKVESDFIKAFGRSLAYCYRLGLATGPLSVVAMREMGWKWETIDRFKAEAKKYAGRVATVDSWLAGWVERAAVVCNTQQQIDILVWVYCQAAQFNTRQPRICKSTVGLELGVSRKSISNLFQKLEKHGLMVQQDEERVVRNGELLSNARIVNLDVEQPNRWTFYAPQWPAPDRSKEARMRKQSIEDRLARYSAKKKSIEL